jgi:hypothetical protein
MVKVAPWQSDDEAVVIATPLAMLSEALPPAGTTRFVVAGSEAATPGVVQPAPAVTVPPRASPVTVTGDEFGLLTVTRMSAEAPG